MNKKGFAVTGIVYTLMVVFIILIITLLAMFSDRKNLLDELKERVLNDVNTYDQALNMSYGPKTASEVITNPYYEYPVKVKGYYDFYVQSADGSYVKATFYLKEGEKIYIKVGSRTYNSGKTEIAINEQTNKLLEVINNTNYLMNKFERRMFVGIVSGKETGITEGKVDIIYSNNKRQNTDLNRVRYVKECLYSNSADERNEWAEIIVLKNGLNYATDAIITGDVDNTININDDNIYNLVSANLENDNKACITVDLGNMYDVDYIYTWHNFSDKRTYYERELSVSSDDTNYRVIDNYEVPESEQGIGVSAFEQAKVLVLGDVAFPIKRYDGKTWIRLFHHNNRSGSVLWDARDQVLNNKGYKAPYKVSGLSFLKNFTRGSGYYELLIEYPELNKRFTWTQQNNFTESSTPGTYIKSPSNDVDINFSGLQKSDSINTVISSTNNKYHIGALHSTDGGIEGYDGIITGTVDLWARVN